MDLRVVDGERMPPAMLGRALRADMEALGDTPKSYAVRRGVQPEVMDMLLDTGGNSVIARLLVQEITARLAKTRGQSERSATSLRASA